MFLKNLRQNICYQNNGRESLDASLYCTESNFSHLPTISLPIFANVSIREKEVTIPNLSCDSHFMGCIFLLLDKAHQDTKQELANLRKGNLLIRPQKNNQQNPILLMPEVTLMIKNLCRSSRYTTIIHKKSKVNGLFYII